ncbi:rRNA pseudouridine synthase [bacterium]|nr:rRNA pseudouridine synthase [bacterium]
MTIVLQKYIAEAGLCSRRQAEELIRRGKVRVNGEIAELGAKVTEADEVFVNEKIIKKAKKIYLILNKPEGYVCTNRYFKGEDNIFDLLVDKKGESAYPKERLFVVGRLDKNSRGLVLITNDGDMTQKITHPKYEHEKEYVVSISNFQFPISKQFINDLIFNFKKGIDISDKKVSVKEVEFLGDSKFKIILTQGMKRQIREMFKVFDLEVVDLVRTRIGSIELGELKNGQWRCLKKDEISRLLSVND